MNKLNNYHVTLNINYPNTKYKKLNQKIDFIIKKHINEFYQYNFNQEDFIYKLNINNHKYTYKNYISIVFFIDKFIGEIHPNYSIETIVYDINTNQFLIMDNLIEKDNFFLNKLSIISREHFLNIPIFQNKNIKDILIEGTKPYKNNFKLFTLTGIGIRFYFERYQIAPYYYGVYNFVIPYEQLNLNI